MASGAVGTRVLACMLGGLVWAASASASSTQESVMMDDPKLLYGTPAEVDETLATMKQLGVDRVRVSVQWRLVTPDPGERRRPDFDAADPASYPRDAFERYDRIALGARRHGLRLLFSVTGPSPLWATGRPARTSIEGTYTPSPSEYGLFVRALGARYSGDYVDPAPPAAQPPQGFLLGGGEPPATAPARQAVPRVDAWSVWNEPNHPSWLTPQWYGKGRRAFPFAPHHYRAMVDAAWDALHATGHGGDLILIGETAPRGWTGQSAISSLRPLEFVRELYCLDARRRPFTGSSARSRTCPATPAERRGFVEAHPALFRASGWAHHAYGFAGAPSRAAVSHPDDVQLAELAGLVRTLDRSIARYGQPNRFPLWITEYGYQTNPPDPFGGISWQRQAAYLNEADFLAYANPRVASMAQFLLYDDGPWAKYPPGNRRHWATFQTGLMTEDGRPKPSFEAFRTPIHVTPSRQSPGGRIRLFGQMRPRTGAPASARVEFLGARASRARPLAHAAASPHGFVDIPLRARSSGSYRLVWTDPATGREHVTRPAFVRVVKQRRR